jgi:hypothetical protein
MVRPWSAMVVSQSDTHSAGVGTCIPLDGYIL